MDRRATLSTLLGKTKKSQKKTTAAAVVTGLDPYSGPWDYELAAHLLRRTMYGPTNAQIKNAVLEGMANTVNQLMTPMFLPGDPINHEYELDPYVAIGESWVSAPYTQININAIRSNRNKSLAAWTIMQLYEEGVSIREKMTLFWHNHFATADVNDPKFKYEYITKLRSNALGNFRELVKIMTIDPLMLRYLNGNQNTAVAPNENYARELLELFTIGKGPLAGPGDYTNYTEDDVVAMAKVLTGWIDLGFITYDPAVEIESKYITGRHDTSDKQLSPRFDNLVISNAEGDEYSILIDIIFQKAEVAYFISRKLYRWFVFHDINPDVESNVIDPMAQMLIANDYEIAPVIEALIRSEHFYEEANRGCLIKNPLDFTIGAVKELNLAIPTGTTDEAITLYYNTNANLFNATTGLQMEYFNPPSVAGWSAFYQAPSYYQLWTNSVTLPGRKFVSTLIAYAAIEVPNGESVEPDFLGTLNAFENPFDVNSVIDEAVRMLFPRDISQNQKDYLKEVLIPGLPDFEWNEEYTLYLNDPTNETLVSTVKNRIRDLFNTMMIMPEYHLS